MAGTLRRGDVVSPVRLITAGDDDRDPADGLPATSQHHLARIASVALALALALCPGVPALVARLQLLARTSCKLSRDAAQHCTVPVWELRTSYFVNRAVM